MKQPEHVKSLAATFRGYATTVQRNPDGWFLMPEMTLIGELVGAAVQDDGSIVFYGWRICDETQKLESKVLGHAADISSRDIVTAYVECDKEGIDSYEPALA